MPDRRVILTFHGIGDPPPHVERSELPFWIGRDVFERALDEVSGRPDVLVTFDDGNGSDFEIALPALRRRGMTAAFFVVASRLDQPGYLTREQLRELAAAGMAIGSHGLQHRSWRSLTDEELEDDLTRGRSVLEDALERPVTEASCPFGEYDRRVLRHLRRLGHERVYTSDGGTARADAWLQPRNTIEGGWDATAGRLNGGEPVRARVVRSARRVVKRLR
jgi:peptidoglycan/xylan/chitin deacetylase (PgdA/CDA1 family)